MSTSRWEAQMYDHKLDPVSGPPPMHRLEYFGPAASGASYNRGAVVSADSTGALVAGCAVGTVGNRPMPMFALQGTADLDVYSDPYNLGDNTPSALPATGGYELATTEFVQTSGGETVAYAVNDFLTCTETGQLTLAGVDAGNSTKPIMGVVSVANNGGTKNAIGRNTVSNYGKPLLHFWTVFFPCVSAE